MRTESTIERIRRIRHELSEECDHDPRKLVAYFQKLQQRHQDRLVSSKRALESKISQQIT
jgi:hypothetical protein